MDFSAVALRNILYHLFHQTIESRYLEIVIVHFSSNNETDSIIKTYEAQFPDQLMIIECDIQLQKEEAFNTALQYASGDFIFTIDSENYHNIDEKTIEEFYIKKLCKLVD